MDKNTQKINQLNETVAQLYQQGRYEQAFQYAILAHNLIRQELGENHPAYATSVNNLALLYKDQGNYADAEPLLRQACEIWRTRLGQDHPVYGTSLNNLGRLYQEMGNYVEAELLYRQASGIDRAALGEDHPDFAVDLNNLGMLYQEMGDYARAESFLRHASNVRRSALGTHHPDYAASLNNLAAMYQDTGNYAQAELLYRQASAIDRAALGEGHPDFAIDLNNLAELYWEMGNYAQAEPLYRQATAIDRKALGEGHPGYANDLNNLAALYYAQGNYAAAEPLLRQARDVRRAVLGADHPDYASSLNNLAVLYHARGNYAAAEPLLRQARDVRRAALGADHPDYASSLNNLAVLYAATNRTAEALVLMQQAAAIQDRVLTQVFSIGSDRERMAFLRTLQASFQSCLSLIRQQATQDSAAPQVGLDLVLRRKAIGAEALAAQRDAILSGQYPDLAPKLRKLTTLRAQIAQQTLAGPGADDPTAYRQRLAIWTGEYEQLEADLARHLPEMSLERQLRTADRSAIARALPPEAALVEFVRTNTFTFTAVRAHGEAQWAPAHYLAFVLSAGAPGDVALIDLGEAAPIDYLIAAFRQAVSGEADAAPRGGLPNVPDMTGVSVRSDRPTLRGALISATRSMRPRATIEKGLDCAALGMALRHALIDPLLSALAGRTRLFLAADGDLTRVPFEVLPLDDQQCVIDAYQISYLSVGRDILRFGTSSQRPPAAPLVVANPDFDLGGRSVELFTPGEPFQQLAGTRREGEQVGRLLQTPPILDDAALEQTLKAHPSPRILHIATHGFFLPDPKHDANDEALGLSVQDMRAGSPLSRLSAVENPLLRAGLALAGANTWLQEHEQVLDPDAEDGILNGVDVSGLDLLDTELVTLSACDTGLGSVQVGEGVFGLRRAFMLAGAKTLVMSLWKVPDRQTQELMELFYHHVLEGIPRADALRAAQLAMKAKYPDPLYWGAFICQGEPGPLPTPKTLLSP